MEILVVGTVSNSTSDLQKDLSRINKSFKNIGNLHFFIVESDSKNNTTQVLQNLSKILNLKFVTLGNLKKTFPERIERLRFCRNIYVEEIRKTYKNYKKWDYIVVADLDGVNKSLTYKSIKSCFQSTEWDACFANQTFGYYDLYALRADKWLNENCFSILNDLKLRQGVKIEKKSRILRFILNFYYSDKLRKKAIYNKMLRINKYSPWIQVNSAFGGLAIYKIDLFLKFNYDFMNLEREIYSEHIDFNYKCVQNAANLFINPRLINCHYNEYNLNKIWLIRFLRSLLNEFSEIRNILNSKLNY